MFKKLTIVSLCLCLSVPIIAQETKEDTIATAEKALAEKVPAKKTNSKEEAPEKKKSAVDNLLESLSDDSDENKEIFFYETKHIRAENLSKLVEGFLTPRGTVGASKESDIIVIEDVPENMERLKILAKRVDQYVPKIVVETRIVEFTLDDDFQKSVNVGFKRIQDSGLVKEISSVLGTPGGSFNPLQGQTVHITPYERSNGDELNVFLRYMQEKGKADILNATNLTVMRGDSASIITGEEVPISSSTTVGGAITTSTTFKDVGTKLRVKPIMIVDDTIRLEINPEVSTVTGFTNDQPIIAIRNAKTTFDVKDGQMLSIGGLMRKEKREVDRRVPYLSSIPLLGWFFRSKRIEGVHTQVVIFLNVRILKNHKDSVIQPSVMPDKVQQEIDKMEKNLPKKKESLKEDKKLILDQK